jgi:hypothetical protein
LQLLEEYQQKQFGRLESVFLEHVEELRFIVLKNPEYTHTHTTKFDFCTNSFGMGIMVSLSSKGL